ncbi:MAG: hypothetical protein QW041_03020 [Candidatus Pacearchaeota archaeon]
MKSYLGKMKQFLIALFALLMLAMIPGALAMTVTVKDVGYGGPVSVQVGETIPIKVTYLASKNLSDVVITAELTYNGKKVSVESKPLDMIEGTTYTETLNLKIPEKIKVTSPGECYILTVRMQDNKGHEISWKEFEITVQRANDKIQIQKVITTYAKAGEPLIVTVVAKNIGSDAQEDVYVKVSIPELNLVAEERMGDIAAIDKGEDEDVATVDVPLRIPEDVEDGDYTLKVEVYSDDNDVEASTTKSINIDGVAPTERFIEVVPIVTSQDVEQGETAIYNLRIANLGDATKTFTVFVKGTEGWATSQINPLVVTLTPESSHEIAIAVTTAKGALIGNHVFTVTIKSDDAEKSISLTANIKEKTVGADALLISVIVLAIVLVILIVILVKTRKTSEATETEESYY